MNVGVDFNLAVRPRCADRIEAAHRHEAAIAIVKLVGLIFFDSQGYAQLVRFAGGIGQRLLVFFRTVALAAFNGLDIAL